MRDVHLLEVNLSLGYPRRTPCRMLTPVFHPNFDDAQVCIGDFWAASEGLDDLVLRIGRMICYKSTTSRAR
jgi:ubiquitin-protein ligase